MLPGSEENPKFDFQMDWFYLFVDRRAELVKSKRVYDSSYTLLFIHFP